MVIVDKNTALIECTEEESLMLACAVSKLCLLTDKNPDEVLSELQKEAAKIPKPEEAKVKSIELVYQKTSQK